MDATQIEREMSDVKRRLSDLEMNSKIMDVETKNQLNRIEEKSSRNSDSLKEIKDDNKKLILAIVVTFIGAVAAFVFRGGLA